MSLFELNPQNDNEKFIEVIEETIDSNNPEFGSKVILFDDNYHTFAQVIYQLQLVIHCTPRTGYIHALEVHTKGKSEVFKGDLPNSLRVSDILREINLKTQILI